MADKTIQDLPRLDQIGVEDLIPVADASNGYNPHAASGAVFRALVKEQAGEAVVEIEAKVESAKQSAEEAEASAESAQQFAGQSEESAARSASSAQQSRESSEEAAGSADIAAAGSTLSQSWAVGGTGTREGEDTDNAKYWAGQAHAASGGGVISFNGRTGPITPQSGDYTAEMVGAIPSVLGATVGDFPVLTEDGQLQGSDKSPADFAPSGFGLGEYPKLISDFNAAVFPGWYSTDGRTVNGPVASSYGDIGSLLVLRHASRIIQLLCCYAPSGIKQMLWFTRGFDGSAFGDWRCLNPELLNGKEYKTGNLWGNKPVYAKLIAFGKLPNAASASVTHGITDLSEIVYCSGSTSDKHVIPTQNYGGTSGDSVSIDAGPENIAILCSNDHSSVTANILIKYTKTTD